VKSTGNDIVALRDINRQRTNHLRFYSKILSDSEQLLYTRQDIARIPFEKFVWLFWSIKESVYKYLRRTEPDLLFSPVKIIISSIHPPSRPAAAGFGNAQWGNKNNDDGEDFYTGIIHIGENTFFSRSKMHDELIATVVSQDEQFEDTWWGIRLINHTGYNYQSESVRAVILNRLAEMLPADQHNLHIEKNERGCPVICNRAGEMDIPVSLSHHDCYVAYSFVLKHPSLPA